MRKRFLSVVLVLLALSSSLFAYSWQDRADTSWYVEGEDTFYISSAEELSGLSVLVNGGNSFENKSVILNRDIDLYGDEWIPIGTIESPFKGTFVGYGCKIKNIEIDKGAFSDYEIDPSKSYLGLFGVVGGEAEIRSLEIEGVDIKGDSYIGSLIGYLLPDSALTLDDIEISGEVNLEVSSRAGGVVGAVGEASEVFMIEVDVDPYSASKIENVSFNYTGDYLGGIIGSFDGKEAILREVKVENLDIIGVGEGVGGIFGRTGDADMEDIDVENVRLEINIESGDKAMSIGAISGIVYPSSRIDLNYVDIERVTISIPNGDNDRPLNAEGYFGTTGLDGSYSDPSNMVRGNYPRYPDIIREGGYDFYSSGDYRY